MENKMVNHWGKWVNPDVPVTGVISLNDVIQFVSDELTFGTNLTAADALQDYIESHINHYNRKPNRISIDKFWDQWEDQPSDNWIIGDWKKDKDGLYEPDITGEYAAIVRESVVQVIWSKYVTKVKNLCSPCYPGQADVNSGKDEKEGKFLSYNLPPEAYEY